MNIILIGAPGSGKGTQAKMIQNKFNIPHISTGDIFRQNIKEQTELGKLANIYISKGQLVPDDVTVAIVKNRLQEKDTKNGYILDGFPRTVYQAEELAKFSKVNNVLLLDVDSQEIIKRIVGRRSCPVCGEIYNTETYASERCAKCGAFLIQREDDKVETVTKRLIAYENLTKPLIEYYRQQGSLNVVNGKNSPDEIFEDILKILKNLEAKVEL